MEKNYEQQVLSVDQGKRCLWLWQSVLYQSLLDVTFAGLATETMKKEAFKVSKWVKTEDFQLVCELANANAEHVAKAILNSYEKSLNDCTNTQENE